MGHAAQACHPHRRHAAGSSRHRAPVRAEYRDPYSDFGVDDLVRWAGQFRPRRPPAEGGSTYSVIGLALLGFILEEVNRKRLDQLLSEEIFKPLGLGDTVYKRNDDQEARLATPHDGRGKPVTTWNYNGLAGAGGLSSSASDVGRLIKAVIAGSSDTELGRAIVDTLEIRRRPPQAAGEGGGLGWTILHTGKPPFVYSVVGRTNGSQAYLLVAPQPKLGAAVLVNSGPRARDTLNPPRRQMTKTFTMAWAALPDQSGEPPAASR